MGAARMWSSRASSTLLGVALLLSASAQGETFRALHPREFENLRSHAQAFVGAKAYQGFALVGGEPGEAWFKIRYQGRVVLAAENALDGLAIDVPAEAETLAPDVVRFRDLMRIWLEYEPGSGDGGGGRD